MYNAVLGTIKKNLFGNYDVISENTLSVTLRDKKGYRYVITCIPKGKDRSFMSDSEYEESMLAYTE